jgi:hypothetical protein
MDDNFFASLGQGLSEREKQAMAAHIYAELEERVGAKLESQINDAQYEEFEAVVAKGNDLELDEWLSRNAPGYEALVEQTLEELKSEAKADPSKFLN